VSEKVLQRAFQIAAVYNVAWGATVAVPQSFFRLGWHADYSFAPWSSSNFTMIGYAR
jgi:hypothetical protein